MGEEKTENGGALVLTSSATVVGFWVPSALALTISYRGSPPIAGKVRLKCFWWVSRQPSGLVSEYNFELAIASAVPTTLAEMDAAERVFPYANMEPGFEGRIPWAVGYACTPIPCGAVLHMNGRRLVCGLRNAHTAPVDLYVGTMLEAVEGGEVSGGRRVLSGEVVNER